ncbi:MAG: 4Fe-4S dicluster domain-containing protein [Candidatus Saliniplasma sp.]
MSEAKEKDPESHRMELKGERKMKIEVDEDYCKGCNLCVYYCPRDALEESEEPNKKGLYPPVQVEDRCNGCRLCELICPDFAITVAEEEEDE